MKTTLGRPKNIAQHEELREQIKTIARRQMAEYGTAAISLRAIAREMGMTAPALYRYYPKMDDLVTALILDAFNAIGEAVEAADAAHPHNDYFGRLMVALVAYRAVALAHPVDFQLIYGNPIPGYQAPSELTVAAARRTYTVVIGILKAALAAGELHPLAEYEHLPPGIAVYLPEMIKHEDYDAAPVILYIAAVGWAKIHGIIMLELFGHIQPVIGDVDAFYRHELESYFGSMGLSPPDR